MSEPLTVFRGRRDENEEARGPVAVDEIGRERPLTESEYRQWVARKAPEIAADLTIIGHSSGLLPGDVRFEWGGNE